VIEYTENEVVRTMNVGVRNNGIHRLCCCVTIQHSKCETAKGTIQWPTPNVTTFCKRYTAPHQRQTSSHLANGRAALKIMRHFEETHDLRIWLQPGAIRLAFRRQPLLVQRSHACTLARSKAALLALVVTPVRIAGCCAEALPPLRRWDPPPGRP
jgi:hypothetical protein